MSPPRQGKGTGRRQPIPKLLAQLRRMDGGDLDFCVELFDGCVVSGCSLSQIATAGAQLFATDDAHVTAVAELGRDVGDLLETYLDPEAFGDPAGVDRVLRLLGSAASWEQAVGETAVWEWFRCVAEAAFAAATGWDRRCRRRAIRQPAEVDRRARPRGRGARDRDRASCRTGTPCVRSPDASHRRYGATPPADRLSAA